jgi:hypothetical protein
VINTRRRRLLGYLKMQANASIKATTREARFRFRVTAGELIFVRVF